MADALTHRGPDSAGDWVNDRGDIAFGHRRLAIVDLSEAGHQPMTCRSGNWTLTYNGELYNVRHLLERFGISRATLRGHSDTEVLLEAIARSDVRTVIEEAIGMFALAAYDHQRDELWIARDRFGEKPLYYTVHNSTFAFASELSALRAVPGFAPPIDRASLVDLLQRKVIRAPYSIFEGVSKLEAGSLARIRRDGSIRHERYYDPSAIALSTAMRHRSDSDALDELEDLLRHVVRERTVSDVPLGAFLSGGIDSSIVVAMMQGARGATARTFTMGFEVDALDESATARATSKALGTEHREWIVRGSDALSVVPQLGRLFDEPFADPSQIPTLLVSRFARENVTVALSGDGGDELFGGYERYRRFERLERLRRLSPPLRNTASRLLTLFSEDSIDRISQGRAQSLLPRSIRDRTGRRAHILAAALRAENATELYERIIREQATRDSLIRGSTRRSNEPEPNPAIVDRSPTDMGMIADTIDYLPNQILTKVDRASMSTSLEVRSPMLDPRLHEFAWSLRPDQRVRDGQGKWILRELLTRYVPDEVTRLPKRGFGIPLSEWLRGPLAPWARDLLSPDAIRSVELLDPGAVTHLWNRHASGAANLSGALWPILMLQSWHQEQRSR